MLGAVSSSNSTSSSSASSDNNSNFRSSTNNIESNSSSSSTTSKKSKSKGKVKEQESSLIPTSELSLVTASLGEDAYFPATGGGQGDGQGGGQGRGEAGGGGVGRRRLAPEEKNYMPNLDDYVTKRRCTVNEFSINLLVQVLRTQLRDLQKIKLEFLQPPKSKSTGEKKYDDLNHDDDKNIKAKDGSSRGNSTGDNIKDGGDHDHDSEGSEDSSDGFFDLFFFL